MNRPESVSSRIPIRIRDATVGVVVGVDADRPAQHILIAIITHPPLSQSKTMTNGKSPSQLQKMKLSNIKDTRAMDVAADVTPELPNMENLQLNELEQLTRRMAQMSQEQLFSLHSPGMPFRDRIMTYPILSPEVQTTV